MKEEKENKKKSRRRRRRRRRKTVVVIFIIVVVGDASPFNFVRDVSGVVVCFYTVFELPVFLSFSLFPERMLMKELLL